MILRTVNPELLRENADLRKVIDHIIWAEKEADSLQDSGMVDNPHLLALRTSAKKAKEVLEKYGV